MTPMPSQDTSGCSSSGSFLGHARYNLDHLPVSIFRAINTASIKTDKLLTCMKLILFQLVREKQMNKQMSTQTIR